VLLAEKVIIMLEFFGGGFRGDVGTGRGSQLWNVVRTTTFIIYLVNFSLSASQDSTNSNAGRTCEKQSLLFEDGHSQFTHTEVLKKLSSKNIFMIGDSLMRYQYLALVHFLRTGKPLSSKLLPNAVEERTWNSWYDFYVGTNGALKPNEFCDCYRQQSPYDERKQFENRYYTDSAYNISVTFFMYNGAVSQGHWNDYGDFDSFRSPLVGFVPPFWKLNIFQLLYNFIRTTLRRKGVPSYAIVNAGHHPHSFNDPNFRVTTRDYALASVDHLIWRTTTYARPDNGSTSSSAGHNDPTATSLQYLLHDAPMCELVNVTCLSVAWTQCVDPSLYWDRLHFKASVYNKMNDELVDIISQLRPEFSSIVHGS
jgi:hypothetical protein